MYSCRMDAVGAKRKSELSEDPTVRTRLKDTTIIHTTVPKRVAGYELLEMLGEGGMGAVFLAQHLSLGRKDALKLIRPDLVRNADVLQRFQREVRTIGSLQHPNILLAYDAGIDNGLPYLATEFVDGVDAHKLIECEGKLSIPDAVEITRQALLGVGHAATLGIIHRDLKPANLLVSSEGVVKVADLGVARLNVVGEDTMTAANLIIGTPDFLSPEQARGDKNLTSAADIYSLGCTLYNLLAGERPFSGEDFDTPLKKVRAHEETSAPPITEYRRDLPDGLREILGRMMSKEIDVRGEDAVEIAECLAPFAEGSDLKSLVSRSTETLKKNAPRIRVTWQTTEAQLHPLNGTPGIPVAVSVEGTAKKKARNRPLIGILGAAAIAVVVWITAAGLGFDPFASGAAHFSPTDPVDQWQDIDFGRVELRGNSNPRHEATWDERGETLFLHSPKSTMLDLGTVDTGNFRLQIGIIQPGWAGCCGIYFGDPQCISEGHSAYGFEIFNFPTRNGNPINLWFAELKAVFADDGTMGIEVFEYERQPIGNMEDELLLEVDFLDGVIQKVSVNGHVMPFDPAKLKGPKIEGTIAFGIMVNQSTASFSTPRIKVYPTKP